MKHITKLNRRTFLVGVGIAAMNACALPTDPSAKAPPQASMLNDAELDEALLMFTRHLFPHPALSNEPYRSAVKRLIEAAASSPELLHTLQGGLAELDRKSGGSWREAPTAIQQKAIESTVGSEFFQAAYQSTLPVLYSHPDLWSLVGYEGSSVEYGGYLHRGFADIDWLPEDDK